MTFFVLAPEHPWVEKITTPEHQAEVDAYVDEARHMSEIERMSTEKEKTGVFTGGFVTNPLSGEQVPVWIADYVLMSYGAGAIMGVPAHDQRDFEFARKFGIPIREVIRPEGEDASDPATWAEARHHLGVMVNSGPFDGTPADEAIGKVTRHLEEQGIGKFAISYRLRDWLISRQRYWGAPIPIVYCPVDGMVPVPEDQLPVVLPENVQFKPTGESPLRYEPDFVNTTCPVCGGPATRETDTMDTFMCSSWYFLRYADPHNDRQAWSEEAEKYGADTVRAYLMFMGPFDAGGSFIAENLEGVWRFMNRFWSLVNDAWVGNHPAANQSSESQAIERLRHKTIKRVTEEYGSFRFNTALAALMECNNALIKQQHGPVARSAAFRDTLESMMQLLAPLAPHITEELWHMTGHSGSIHQSIWPTYDEAMTHDETFTLVVQVNGKVRERIEVQADITEGQARQVALENPRVASFIGENTVQKVIYVPGKLINIVVRNS